MQSEIWTEIFNDKELTKHLEVQDQAKRLRDYFQISRELSRAKLFCEEVLASQSRSKLIGLDVDEPIHLSACLWHGVILYARWFKST